jgi:opacity protein-like surface antigen
MKKNVFIILVLGITSYSQAQIAVGGGLGFNERVSSVGLTVKEEIGITDEIAITPNISYFFGSGSLVGFSQNLFAVDVNATYAFDIIENLKVYPLVGLNYSRYRIGTSSFLFDDVQDVGVSNGALGANIGAGAQWQFTDSLSVYFEPKFVASNYSQVVVNAGVLFKL